MRSGKARNASKSLQLSLRQMWPPSVWKNYPRIFENSVRFYGSIQLIIYILRWILLSISQRSPLMQHITKELMCNTTVLDSGRASGCLSVVYYTAVKYFPMSSLVCLYGTLDTCVLSYGCWWLVYCIITLDLFYLRVIVFYLLNVFSNQIWNDMQRRFLERHAYCSSHILMIIFYLL